LTPAVARAERKETLMPDKRPLSAGAVKRREEREGERKRERRRERGRETLLVNSGEM
jgi:hypothetical protein